MTTATERAQHPLRLTHITHSLGGAAEPAGTDAQMPGWPRPWSGLPAGAGAFRGPQRREHSSLSASARPGACSCPDTALLSAGHGQVSCEPCYRRHGLPGPAKPAGSRGEGGLVTQLSSRTALPCKSRPQPRSPFPGFLQCGSPGTGFICNVTAAPQGNPPQVNSRGTMQ